MSLDWDLTEVHNWRDLDRARTDAMIFATMFVGIGDLTEANAVKFHDRLHAYELLSGPIVQTADGTDPLTTFAQVRAYVGLKTNVFPAESDAAFARKLFKIAKERAERARKREQEQEHAIATYAANFEAAVEAEAEADYYGRLRELGLSDLAARLAAQPGSADDEVSKVNAAAARLAAGDFYDGES